MSKLLYNDVKYVHVSHVIKLIANKYDSEDLID